MKILPESFYARDPRIVAKELLGKIFVLGKCRGKIVETEAYLGKDDPGAIGNRRVKNIPSALLNPPGYAFVYFTYGNHWMFNVVAKSEELGAVLIRAVEPLTCIEEMQKNRNAEIKNLTNGPGKFTQAFGVDKKLNEVKLNKKDFCILDSDEKPEIVSAKRIGIPRDLRENLRYYIKGNIFVSKLK